jgi:hypothetical protein
MEVTGEVVGLGRRSVPSRPELPTGSSVGVVSRQEPSDVPHHGYLGPSQPLDKFLEVVKR